MRARTTVGMVLGSVLTALLAAGTAQAQFDTSHFNKSPIVDLRSEQAQQGRIPVQYNDNGFVRTQYVRAEDLSPEELDALVADLDRVKQRRSQGVKRHIQPVSRPNPAGMVAPYEHSHDHMSPADRARHIEYYHSPSARTVSQPPRSVSTSPHIVNAQFNVTQARSGSRYHTVSRGETLYSLSRRYGVTVSDLQRTNQIHGTTISIGQVLTIPGGQPNSRRLVPGGSPVVSFANTQTRTYPDGRQVRRIDRPIDEQPVLMSSSSASNAVWAVLPEDTLFQIAERTCLSVDQIVEVNGIRRSTALIPGQRLTIPAGHCLQR